MRVKRQVFLCALTHLYSRITVYQQWWSDRKGSVSLTPLGVMWVFCVFTPACASPVHVCQTCLFCAVWVLRRQKPPYFEALGKNLSPPAPAPFLLSPAGANPPAALLQNFPWSLLLSLSVCTKLIVPHVGIRDVHSYLQAKVGHFVRAFHNESYELSFFDLPQLVHGYLLEWGFSSFILKKKKKFHAH